MASSRVLMEYASPISFLMMIASYFVMPLLMNVNVIAFWPSWRVMRKLLVKLLIDKKHLFFFSRNTRPEIRVDIQHMLGARIMEDCEKYLSLPMVGGKLKVNTFRELHEKINKRVLGWNKKFISKAAREVLIKTVAQAILTYSMGIFKLPKALCDSINSILAKYWWGKRRMRRKSIELIGKSCVLLRPTVVWVFGTSKLLTWQCWLNKYVDSFTTLILFSIGFTSLDIFRSAPLWMLIWALTPLMCGEAYWLLGTFSRRGHTGV